MKIKRQDHSKYFCEDHKFSELYDSFLSEYQKDILRIVQKYRRSYHALSFDDLVSECNLSLIKQKKKILETFNEVEFTQDEFKKIAYCYVRNTINWTHYAEKNSTEYQKKVDIIHETEDGPKTTFEVAIENEGEEDVEIEGSDSSDGYKRFFHILSEYSYLLTDSETKLISFLSEGLNQDQISQKLRVTRQAVSFAFVNMQKKLSSCFSFQDIINHDSGKLVCKGKDSINSFFSDMTPSITIEDKQKIKSFVKDNPYQYNSKQINEKLFNNKYYPSQIMCFCRQKGLRSLLLKVRKSTLNEQETKKLTKFFKEGKSVYAICRHLKRGRKVVIDKIEELKKSGILK